MNGLTPKLLYIAHYYSEAERRSLGLTFEYSPGGLNKILPVLSLLTGCCDVTLLSPGYTRRPRLVRIKRRAESLPLDGHAVPVIYPGYFALGKFSFPEITAACLRECLRRKPDLILFYNFRLETLVPALLTKLLGRAKIVCQFEDGLHVLFPPWSFRGLAFRALHFLGKAWSDGFTLVNGGLIPEFPEAASVIMPFILSDQARADYAPAIYRLRDKPVVQVAYSGFLDIERGADIFLEAARRLGDHPRLRFFIIGQGPLRDQVVAQARTHGNLHDCGFLVPAEAERRLQKMDILVNPQRLARPFARYSFPSKVMRYILLNKPIVSTAFPDISDVAAPGLYFYGHDDPGELARLLARLADQDVEVDYRRLFDKFSESKTRTRVLALLKYVQRRRPGRSSDQR